MQRGEVHAWRDKVWVANPPFHAPGTPAGPEEVDALYHFAKWNFECGNYSAAAEYLYHYRTLSTNPERNVGAMWGKVAADILLQVRRGLPANNNCIIVGPAHV